MPSPTTNKGLTYPANGADVGFWDTPVNADWNAIDAAFGGTTSLNATSASGTVNLTLTQYTTPIIKITGTLTANVTYSIPSGVGGFWSIFQNTTGAFTVTFASAGGGSSIVLPQGFSTAVISDGTNIGLWNTASGTAAGSTTQVQFNSSGVLAGSANFTWNGTVLGLKGALAINGASSGAVAFQVPAAAGAVTYTLPSTSGSAGQFLTSDGGSPTAVLSWTGAVGGVTSLSFGTTGLTPATGTGGSITVAGTLATANGGTGLTGFSSGGAVYATSASALTTGILPLTGGGLGVNTVPTKGAIPLGTGTGYAVGTLTAGANITITNGTGTVTIAATGLATGTVTSVNGSGGSTGLTLTGGPITGSGTLTIGGTLAVASGGSGASTAAGARTAFGLGTAATQNTGTSGANLPFLNGGNAWSGAETHSGTESFAAAFTPPVVVTFSATAMTVNCALSNVFTTTFTANVTSAPTISNPNDGQTINWFITQDGTGSRTMTWPTSFKWPGGTAGVLSTAASAVDLVVATYRASTGFFYASLGKSFS